MGYLCSRGNAENSPFGPIGPQHLRLDSNYPGQRRNNSGVLQNNEHHSPHVGGYLESFQSLVHSIDRTELSVIPAHGEFTRPRRVSDE